MSVMTMLPALMFLLPEKREVFKKEKVDFATVWGHTLDTLKSGRFWLIYELMFLGGGAEF